MMYKRLLIALIFFISLPLLASPTSLPLCDNNMEEVFACTLDNGKAVSLCKTGKNITYRYGTAENIELSYPAMNDKPLKSRLITNKEDLSLKQDIFFNRGKYHYVLSDTLEIVDLMSGETKETYALDVDLKGKSIFSEVCKTVHTPFPDQFGSSFQ